MLGFSVPLIFSYFCHIILCSSNQKPKAALDYRNHPTIEESFYKDIENIKRICQKKDKKKAARIRPEIFSKVLEKIPGIVDGDKAFHAAADAYMKCFKSPLPKSLIKKLEEAQEKKVVTCSSQDFPENAFIEIAKLLEKCAQLDNEFNAIPGVVAMYGNTECFEPNFVPLFKKISELKYPHLGLQALRLYFYQISKAAPPASLLNLVGQLPEKPKYGLAAVITAFFERGGLFFTNESYAEMKNLFELYESDQIYREGLKASIFVEHNTFDDSLLFITKKLILAENLFEDFIEENIKLATHYEDSHSFIQNAIETTKLIFFSRAILREVIQIRQNLQSTECLRLLVKTVEQDCIKGSYCLPLSIYQMVTEAYPTNSRDFEILINILSFKSVLNSAAQASTSAHKQWANIRFIFFEIIDTISQFVKFELRELATESAEEDQLFIRFSEILLLHDKVASILINISFYSGMSEDQMNKGLSQLNSLRRGFETNSQFKMFSPITDAEKIKALKPSLSEKTAEQTFDEVEFSFGYESTKIQDEAQPILDFDQKIPSISSKLDKPTSQSIIDENQVVFADKGTDTQQQSQMGEKIAVPQELQETKNQELSEERFLMFDPDVVPVNEPKRLKEEEKEKAETLVDSDVEQDGQVDIGYFLSMEDYSQYQDAMAEHERLKLEARQQKKTNKNICTKRFLPRSQYFDHSRAINQKIQFVSEEQAPATPKCEVMAFDVMTLRMLHHESNQVAFENYKAQTSLTATTNGTQSYQWVFRPDVTIDKKTYKFLCQVFGLIRGKKELTFKKFLKAFNKINPRNANRQDENDVSNRSVFKFDHVIIIGDTTYIPRIGGVHPEHLSSGFNHKQVSGFLENAGVHPYFFTPIR